MSDSAPDLDTWLNLPREELASIVAGSHLSVKLALDGTTRHYLLKRPNERGEVTDFSDYARISMDALTRAIDLLFSCGVETMMVLNVWPPDVDRREEHLRRTTGGSRNFMLAPAALDFYRRWDARVRLYGNYDISPVFSPVVQDLLAIERELEDLTPTGVRLLLWGYYGGRGTDEVIARSVLLHEKLGRLPTEDELREACFPFGPKQLDIFIGSGWLRFGNVDAPPVLNVGQTDFYSLLHLPLDLTESEVRRILYDRLFSRSIMSFTTVVKYTPQVLEPLRLYFAEHSECVLGLGHVVGDGFWQPDHVHVDRHSL